MVKGVPTFPSSQRRGGAKRRGGQFGETFRRSEHPVCAARPLVGGAATLEASPYRARASRLEASPYRARASRPPLRGGE